MQILDFAWLGLVLFIIALALIVIGVIFLVRSGKKPTSSLAITASDGETVGPSTVYTIKSRITVAGRGSLKSSVLSLRAQSPDKNMGAVWDQQTICLGSLHARTLRTLETKITIPVGCDVQIIGILSTESVNNDGKTEIFASDEIVLRADSWKENEN